MKTSDHLLRRLPGWDPDNPTFLSPKRPSVVPSKHAETLKALRADPNCQAVREAKGSQVWLLAKGSLASVKRALKK